MKNKKRIADSRPEGCICEQFAYLLNLRAYPNSSDMNELGETAVNVFKGEHHYDN